MTEYNSFINSKSNSTKETLVKSPIRHIKISGNKIIFSEAVYLAVDTFQNKPKEEYNRRKYMRRLRFCVRLTLTTGRPNCFFLVSECTKGPVHTYNNSIVSVLDLPLANYNQMKNKIVKNFDTSNKLRIANFELISGNAVVISN